MLSFLNITMHDHMKAGIATFCIDLGLVWILTSPPLIILV